MDIPILDAYCVTALPQGTIRNELNGNWSFTFADIIKRGNCMFICFIYSIVFILKPDSTALAYTEHHPLQ